MENQEQKQGPIMDEGYDKIEELLGKKKFQRVFGACVGYLKGFTAGAELMYLSKDEIDEDKVDNAYAKKFEKVPDEREPKLNVSLIGCLAKSLHQLDI